MTEAKLIRIKRGWAARGNGWAVHAASREEALQKFEEADRRHKEIDGRPLYYERIKAAEAQT